MLYQLIVATVNADDLDINSSLSHESLGFFPTKTDAKLRLDEYAKDYGITFLGYDGERFKDYERDLFGKFKIIEHNENSLFPKSRVAELIEMFYGFVGYNDKTREWWLSEDGFHHALVDFLYPDNDKWSNQEYAETLDSVQSEFEPFDVDKFLNKKHYPKEDR